MSGTWNLLDSPALPRRQSHHAQYLNAVTSPIQPSPSRNINGNAIPNMNHWQDAYDFSSPVHFSSSAQMTSRSYGLYSASPDPYDRVPSLERDYCSNFTCCGLHLSDLHSLVDHFEQAHVVVFDSAGYPIFPRTDLQAFDVGEYQPDPPTQLTGHPMTSLVVSYPQPDPSTYGTPTGQEVQSHYHSEPSSPLSVESPTPSAYYHQPTILDHDSYKHEPSVTFDASSQASPTTPNHANTPNHAESELSSAALPPSSFVVESQYRRGDTYTFTHRQRAHKSSSANKPRPYPRRREKAHKCPVCQISILRQHTTPGCLKSYLNPNGLKYHIEKGTCKFEPPNTPPS